MVLWPFYSSRCLGGVEVATPKDLGGRCEELVSLANVREDGLAGCTLCSRLNSKLQREVLEPPNFVSVHNRLSLLPFFLRFSSAPRSSCMNADTVDSP